MKAPDTSRLHADAELAELFGAEPFTRDVEAPRELEDLTGPEWTGVSFRLAVAIGRVLEDAGRFGPRDLINITLAPRMGAETPAFRVNLWRLA